MIVKDLFQEVDVARVVARAIFEDRWREKDVDGWITKYYAQFIQLKNSKVRKSEYMLYFTVHKDKSMQYGDVGGFCYSDLRGNNPVCYAIGHFNVCKYVSQYVPEHTIGVYGLEIVASEVLREYGVKGYDDKYVCPEEIRTKIWEVYRTLKHELFVPQEGYEEECLQEFCKFMRENKHKAKVDKG